MFSNLQLFLSGKNGPVQPCMPNHRSFELCMPHGHTDLLSCSRFGSARVIIKIIYQFIECADPARNISFDVA
jgi:hypothetical protein